MMRPTAYICAALLSAAAGLPACGEGNRSAAEIGRDVGESVDDAAAKLRAATRDFSDRASRKLDEFDVEINKLRDRPRTGAAEEQSRADRLVDDLRRKRDDIAADLRALGDTVADKWHELKAKIEAALDDLERAIRDASS